MKLDFIGIGGAFNPKLGSNCAYIKEKDKILFIDMGLDSFYKIIKHHILKDIKEIYIIITHLHGDHVGGLPTFLQYTYSILNIQTNIIKNSETFTKNLCTILDLTGVKKDNYQFIENNNFPFSFNYKLKTTTHTPLLECYSIIFEKDNQMILYTSDSNDINYIKEKIEDKNITKIYTEVGENSPVHIEYKQLKQLPKEKLILMHIQSMELLKKIKRDHYKVPKYLK